MLFLTILVFLAILIISHIPFLTFLENLDNAHISRKFHNPLHFSAFLKSLDDFRIPDIAHNAHLALLTPMETRGRGT